MTRLYPLTSDGLLWTPIRRLAYWHRRQREAERRFRMILRWTPPCGEPDRSERMVRLFMALTTRRPHPCDEHRAQVEARRRKVRR